MASVLSPDERIALVTRFNGDVDPSMASAVEDVLLSGRFRYLGLNKDQCPVISIHWMWGRFLDVPGGLDTILHAQVAFLRRTRGKVKLSVPDKEPHFLSISIGGPPPMHYVQEWLRVREAIFPAYAPKLLFYPIEADTARGIMITAFMTKCDQGSNIEMVPTSADLIRGVNGTEGFIPDDILHVNPATADQRQAITKQRADIFMAAADGPKYVIKSTFIHTIKPEDDSKPCLMKRSSSFSGASTADPGLTDPGFESSGSETPQCSPKYVRVPGWCGSIQSGDAVPSLDSDVVAEPKPEGCTTLPNHFETAARQLRAAAEHCEATARWARAEVDRTRSLCENVAHIQQEKQGEALTADADPVLIARGDFDSNLDILAGRRSEASAAAEPEEKRASKEELTKRKRRKMEQLQRKRASKAAREVQALEASTLMEKSNATRKPESAGDANIASGLAEAPQKPEPVAAIAVASQAASEDDDEQATAQVCREVKALSLDGFYLQTNSASPKVFL